MTKTILKLGICVPGDRFADRKRNSKTADALRYGGRQNLSGILEARMRTSAFSRFAAASRIQGNEVSSTTARKEKNEYGKRISINRS
jgi:hypothetical protein